jgi:hypothetical protein
LKEFNFCFPIIPMIGFMLVSGFFRLTAYMPSYSKYTPHYMSYQTYSFEALAVNEFAGALFTNDGGTRLFASPNDPPGLVSGESILSFYGYEDVSKWSWLAIMASVALFFHVLFYAGLRFLNRGERLYEKSRAVPPPPANDDRVLGPWKQRVHHRVAQITRDRIYRSKKVNDVARVAC